MDQILVFTQILCNDQSKSDFRFSFPTVEESPPSPAFLLSPPTTPTRKSQEVTDKPKRPMNAFMLFAKRYRLELIQTNPGKDNR